MVWLWFLLLAMMALSMGKKTVVFCINFEVKFNMYFYYKLHYTLFHTHNVMYAYML